MRTRACAVGVLVLAAAVAATLPRLQVVYPGPPQRPAIEQASERVDARPAIGAQAAGSGLAEQPDQSIVGGAVDDRWPGGLAD